MYECTQKMQQTNAGDKQTNAGDKQKNAGDKQKNNDKSNNQQSVKNLTDKLEKAEKARIEAKDKLLNEQSKSKPLYAITAAINEDRAHLNLIDLNITDREINFENVNIQVSYQEVQNSLKSIQKDILSSDAEGQSKKLEEDSNRTYLQMLDDRLRTENLMEELITNMNNTTLAYDRMRKIMEGGFGRDVRTSTAIRALITSFDRYVENTSEENNRLRNIINLNASNVKTVTGGRCIEAPKVNALTGRLECLADTLEDVGVGWLSSGKQRVQKVEKVSREEYNKYYQNKDEYDRRNRLGGLEGNTFIKDVKDPIAGKTYVLMTQIMVQAKRLGSASEVQLPIGVGALFTYTGTQGGIGTFGQKHTFKLVDNENKSTDEIVRRFAIDRSDLYKKDITLNIADLAERV